MAQPETAAEENALLQGVVPFLPTAPAEPAGAGKAMSWREIVDTHHPYNTEQAWRMMEDRRYAYQIIADQLELFMRRHDIPHKTHKEYSKRFQLKRLLERRIKIKKERHAARQLATAMVAAATTTTTAAEEATTPPSP